MSQRPPERTFRGGTPPETVRELAARLGWCGEDGSVCLERLPFCGDDATAGTETELQVAVCGRRDAVDLPLVIEHSNYYANIVRRAAAGDTPRSLISGLERFLADNPDNVWENSWVRFPIGALSPHALRIFQEDLRGERGNLSAPLRSDADRFFVDNGTERLVRVPVSYLLKLSLADLIGREPSPPGRLVRRAVNLMDHFLSDNTSPETFSFHVTHLSRERGRGASIARETTLRYLMTQLLVMYANEQFGLRERGEEAVIYLAPHPPVRQKELNGVISDSFYRELFMSPCLSGWTRGEEKFRYMELCHQVLSRSQLNALSKLKEAGIILNDLVVLPTLSSVSLANNGLHLSIGSSTLAELLAAGEEFTPLHEKVIGDLVIKIVEHFLPLFVGTYSAAPYRLGFTDFHPERALGFLPHELDYTHLRMIWRRWRKKADISVFGHPLTPFGPSWLDRAVSTLFSLKGDFIPDFRLIDYLVSLLSTPRSPALDGRSGNTDRLRNDLAEMGIFDSRMSVYLLYKLREFGQVGFSGFEGRHYSLFPSLSTDLAHACNLQQILTALAFRMVATGEISHPSIPDDPSTESERRFPFFASAIGLPTFFVARGTGNLLMRRLISRTSGTRSSRRYSGYLRVPLDQFRLALVNHLETEGKEIIESLGMEGTMDDLRRRLHDHRDASAVGRLTGGIIAGIGRSNPLHLPATEFNREAERYYRTTLKRQHLQEGLDLFDDACRELDKEAESGNGTIREWLAATAGEGGARRLLARVRDDILRERLHATLLRRIIFLLVASIERDADRNAPRAREYDDGQKTPPVRRAV